MDHAWIDDRPVELQAACAEAARLLQQSRLPVIAGLGTDVAGARAAITLAQRAGAVIDHMHSEELLRDLEVMRDAGIMATTSSEARQRADVLLLVGNLPEEAWLRLLPLRPDSGEQTIIWLCPRRERRRDTLLGVKVRAIGSSPDQLAALLAAVRAAVAGRPTGSGPVGAKTLRTVADQLKAARFGIAVWSAAFLDALTIEMLCGLIKDLNAKTRFSGLPLPPGDNALGVLQVCGWMSALPPRTGFARGVAEHDPWRFDARRLIESGEADCVVWISAYQSRYPPWLHHVPTIALTAYAASFSGRPRVHIGVGRPGINHDSVQYLRAAGTLTWAAAAAKRTTIRVSDALDQIAASLPARVGSPC